MRDESVRLRTVADVPIYRARTDSGIEYMESTILLNSRALDFLHYTGRPPDMPTSRPPLVMMRELVSGISALHFLVSIPTREISCPEFTRQKEITNSTTPYAICML